MEKNWIRVEKNGSKDTDRLNGEEETKLQRGRKEAWQSSKGIIDWERERGQEVSQGDSAVSVCQVMTLQSAKMFLLRGYRVTILVSKNLLLTWV